MTIIILIDGTKIYVQILIDNFSRYIVGWSVTKFQSGELTAKLLRKGAENSRKLGLQWKIPEIFTDGGPENDNEWVDKLIKSGYIVRTIAQTHQCRFSNSLVEALNRSLKINCLYNHPLNTIADIKRLVNYYLNQHNDFMPHSAFNGATPLQMFTGTWTKKHAKEMKQKLVDAKVKRREYRRSFACGNCG